ncbi:hypothetical protein C2S52_006732 [Perilla frutescens var. hirtella]|nr:hypothetical protein C2S52_006732 [Perilla frutescens var. hirtella]
MQAIQRWNDLERTTLLEDLLHGAPHCNMANVRSLGYFVKVVAARLTGKFDDPVTQDDVVMEVLNLKDRYINFMDFICNEGVRYDEHSNKVRPTRIYMKRFSGVRVIAFFLLCLT